MNPRLPIEEVLDELRGCLATAGVGVLVAPPGAGKTTAVAPALLNEDWCGGQIILTSPRRVAARAAAERMAEMLGEKPGQTIGYATRLDTRQSARTRVLVVTEAIFVNRMLADPELAGVSAVLFDEAHERHLDTDLGLALALEARSVLREDLRVLVMSATIDGSRFSDLLGENAPVIESTGRNYPCDIKWLGRDPLKPVEDQMVSAISRAFAERDSDILAFLPGVREIERVRNQLESRFRDIPILPLHGQVGPADQRAAIRRDPDQRRRIVLATAIAETSLTLDGVNIVVDSGLARYGEYDSTAGTTRLVTRVASQAAARQRAGRAGRQAPGVVYRLWDEHGHAGRPEFAPPEMETADLAPLVLSLAEWGTQDPATLKWLDPPPSSSLAVAREQLRRLDALDDQGRITPRGSKIAQLPVDPVSAATILYGAEFSHAEEAARIALLLQERGLGGRSEDLLQRLSRWKTEKGRRAEASRKLARHWAVLASKLVTGVQSDQINPAVFLALARKDMIAKKRDRKGESWISAAGRGFVLDPSSPLASAEWIIIGNAQGQAKGARIVSAAELTDAEIERCFCNQIEESSIINWNKDKKAVEPRRERRLGAIRLASVPDADPDQQAIVDTLVEKALENLGELLPPDLLARGRFLGLDQLSQRALADTAGIWLEPLLDGRRDLEIRPSKITETVLSLLDWETRQHLDGNAPTHFVTPAGTRHPIDYTGDDAPSVEIRVQALFGLDRHPMIGSVPLLLKLTSPAGRPIQSTRDLPGFWRGSWSDVAKEMKGRYPKHRWPDQPWAEKPSLKTKNAFNRDAS